MGKNKGTYKTKKRKFSGNRFTSENQCISSSSKKLKLDISDNLNKSTKPKPKFSDISKNPVGYRMIDMEMLSEGLQTCLACKVCNGNVSFVETNIKGLGSKILIQCETCNPKAIGCFTTSKVVCGSPNVYEINRRSIYAMRSIGQGLMGLKKFCGLMNMPPPVAQSTYNLVIGCLLKATKDVATEAMHKATLEEINETEETATNSKTDLTVSGDGTWMRRGHTSLYGVCTIIGANSGKILDVDVLSSFCQGCNSWKGLKTGDEYQKWLQEHKDSGKCNRNHFGSAGNMEVEGIKKMFHRSEAENGVRYCSYIGDGDTATYPAICDSQPYGPDVTIVKEECVGHVQKRMYSRLSKLKEKNKSTILSDGKKIGGKNRLTGQVIDQLCIYYGNAIRGNSNDLTGMRKSIWAIWNHKASTDENPRHHFCPKGPDSWCTYQRAICTNKVHQYKHKNTIPVSIMDFIKPVFLDLSAPNLLRRCLKGKTQNANESYNSVLWSICPKKGFAGKNIVEIAAYEAAILYNEGNTARSKVLQHLNMEPGKYFESAMKSFDILRVRHAEKKAKLETLESRRARRKLRLEKEQKDKEEEGVTYAAGEF